MAVIAPQHLTTIAVSCSIRSAELSDAEQILALTQLVATETEYLSREPAEITRTLEEQRNSVQAAAAAERDSMLVAVVDDEIVGIAVITTRPLVRFRHQGVLGMTVARAQWGRGIGRALLQATCDWADAVGLLKITLHVVVDNTRALKLYESMGFEVEGRLRSDTKQSDGFHDTFVMARMATR